MGYIKHNAMVLTSWEGGHIQQAHKAANEILGDEIVSDLVGPLANGQRSFFIAPDGSKEGWQESDDYDSKRNAFIAWLKEKNLYVEWVHLSIGSDNEEDTEILEIGKYREE